MTLRLHARLTLAFGALLVALAGMLVFWIARIAEQYHAEVTQRLNAGVAMYVTGELALLNDQGINRAALDELSRRVMTVNPSADVYLLAPDGRVLASLKPEDRIVAPVVDMAPVRRFLADPEERPIYGADPTGTGRREPFSVAPVLQDDRLLGYLYVVLGGERYESVVAAVRDSYTLKLGLVVAGAILVATFALGGGLFAALTLPLRRLARRMREWSRRTSGERDEHPAPPPGDEIRELEVQFDTMAAQIEAQIDALRTVDTQRRELVANVSHDLRTPLASLRGYLETILIKHGTLSAEQRREYLEVASRHAQHLERLIAALFELSKLESGAVIPAVEPFAVDELLQDVALRFRLRAEQLGVEIVTSAAPGTPLALGDLSLVERVLENLLDNALRHTSAGGRISLEVRAERNHLRVAVVDTGSGVGAHDLPRVFDRHYRGTERAAAGRGGLGLAIVRRIVELHGESVSLTSTPGVGTCVEFGLPVSAAVETRELRPPPPRTAEAVR